LVTPRGASRGNDDRAGASASHHSHPEVVEPVGHVGRQLKGLRGLTDRCCRRPTDVLAAEGALDERASRHPKLTRGAPSVTYTTQAKKPSLVGGEEELVAVGRQDSVLEFEVGRATDKYPQYFPGAIDRCVA
jgi:hypothetical protein